MDAACQKRSLDGNHIIILFSTANRTNRTYFLKTLGMRTSVFSLQKMISIYFRLNGIDAINKITKPRII
jgi:hypothetical protein